MAVEHARDDNRVCPHCGKDDFPTPLAAAYCCLDSD